MDRPSVNQIAPGTHLEKSNGKIKKSVPSAPIHHIVLLAALYPKIPTESP
jgi:hypothetical protein